MNRVEELRCEAGMTLLRGVREGGKPVYVVRGPMRQEKIFFERSDAETYFHYYVARCRREQPADCANESGNAVTRQPRAPMLRTADGCP